MYMFTFRFLLNKHRNSFCQIKSHTDILMFESITSSLMIPTGGWLLWPQQSGFKNNNKETEKVIMLLEWMFDRHCLLVTIGWLTLNSTGDDDGYSKSKCSFFWVFVSFSMFHQLHTQYWHLIISDLWEDVKTHFLWMMFCTEHQMWRRNGPNKPEIWRGLVRFGQQFNDDRQVKWQSEKLL